MGGIGDEKRQTATQQTYIFTSFIFLSFAWWLVVFFSLNKKKKRKNLKIHKNPTSNQLTNQSKKPAQQKLQAQNYFYSLMYAFYGTDIFILVHHTCSFHCIWKVPHTGSHSNYRYLLIIVQDVIDLYKNQTDWGGLYGIFMKSAV